VVPESDVQQYDPNLPAEPVAPAAPDVEQFDPNLPAEPVTPDPDSGTFDPNLPGSEKATPKASASKPETTESADTETKK